MKLLILGAAGRAARAVISLLPSLGHIERVFLADHNAEALCKTAADLRRFPVSPRYLDAENERSLHERMIEAEVVLGCLGPFHRHEARIARAAIAAGRDYLSLCDDPAAMQEVMILGDEAKQKGVRVLCGCGMTPGLSNLLACRANAALDDVEAVEIAWFLDMGSDLGTATLEHLLRSFSGKAPSYSGGSPARTRAAGWEETVEFPPPVGWQTVSHLGHPEPVTLPGNLPGLRDMWFKAGVGGKGRNLALHTLAWMGGEDSTELRLAALLAAARGITRHGKEASFSSVRVTARGSCNGIRCDKIFSVSGEYYRLSALVLVAAAESMLKAGLAAGVYAPEDVLDRRPFYGRLYRAGLRIFDGEARL
jgi:lysine 6-dehydrogenase